MIGQDCKYFEENIDKFVQTFLKSEEVVSGKSFEKLRQVLQLYRAFKDLAYDVRSTKSDLIRANSFSSRAEAFFQKFKKFSMGKSCARKPYLHYLREHIGDLMIFWGESLGWGYGYFNCNAGEHLNKRIKQLEFSCTNLNQDRFKTIMQTLRVKQFYFTDGVLKEKKDVTCSACKIPGHNRKNKSCPLHPSQPEPYFSDSETEDLH